MSHRSSVGSSLKAIVPSPSPRSVWRVVLSPGGIRQGGACQPVDRARPAPRCYSLGACLLGILLSGGCAAPGKPTAVESAPPSEGSADSSAPSGTDPKGASAAIRPASADTTLSPEFQAPGLTTSGDSELRRDPAAPLSIAATTRRTSAGLPEPLPGYPSWPRLAVAGQLDGISGLQETYLQTPNAGRSMGDVIDGPLERGSFFLREFKLPEDDFIRAVFVLENSPGLWVFSAYERASRDASFTSTVLRTQVAEAHRKDLEQLATQARWSLTP